MMHKIFLAFVVVAALLFPAIGEAGEIQDEMRNVSVTIMTTGANGSGVLRKYKDDFFIITCGHVAEGARNSQGKFNEVRIAQYNYINGLRLNINTAVAEVVAYSAYESGDIAILKVKDKGRFHSSVRWGKRAKVGESVWHCGSHHGWANAQSLTYGAVIKSIGGFDIMSFISFEGSSGGCAFDEQGNYVGMVARREKSDSVTKGFVIPIDNIKKFANDNKLGFLFED
jgi:S1-C subfamily serine protease